MTHAYVSLTAMNHRGHPMEDAKSTQLKTYIATHTPQLRRILRQYVVKFGLATGTEVESSAEDVLNTVVTEALTHTDRLSSIDNPLPWLLGIAVNIIRQQRDQKSRLEHREPLIHDLYPASSLNEDELIDRFVGLVTRTDHSTLEHDQHLAQIFQYLTDDEARLIKLAILYDLNSNEIGQALGITSGAVRVRLHRTIKKIRDFWGVK